MYTMFIGAKNAHDSQKAGGCSFDVLKEAAVQEIVDAGLEVDDWVEARAVVRKYHPEAAEVEQGVLLLFDDEESCRRAAWLLKSGLRCGAYTVKLNEELPMYVFRMWFDYDQDGVDTLDKAAAAWQNLVVQVWQQTGEFVPAVLYETPRGIKVVGSLVPYGGKKEAQGWKKAVCEIVKHAENLTLPDFCKK